MHLERKLQFGVAALMALSTLMLGMGEESVLMPLVATVIAFAAVYITDIYQWLQLDSRTSDLLGVCAAAWAVFRWQRDTTDAGLLALLDFVVYGQFVLQFRRKTIRTYWLLIAISFMEAAVSTALNESLVFGILLVTYVILLVAVLSIFYLYREQKGAAQDELRAQAAASAAAVGNGNERRWRQELIFSGHGQGQQNDAAANWPLTRLLAGMGGVSVVMACLVFIIIPRPQRGSWREVEEETAEGVVGFSSEVRLGELGAISESEEEVLELQLSNPETQELIELEDEPLIRGVVLTTYERRRWRRDMFYGNGLTEEQPPAGAQVTLQKYVVRPLDTKVLFSMYPAYSRVKRPDIFWDGIGEQLSGRNKRDTIEYELATTAIVGKRMAPIVDAQRAPDEIERQRLLALPRAREGVDPLAGTRALAEQLVANIPAENPAARVQAIANYLRNPANFRYSLDAVTRSPDLDPVEDFLTRHPVGHCEYFASSLAVMLRAIGIPSRLAIGFKGGDWNGAYYQVRAMNAHAWVEAYLSPEQLPDELPPFVTGTLGVWMIEDPTAAAGDQLALTNGAQLLKAAQELWLSLRTSWRNYVLGLNHERQQEGVYQPLREFLGSIGTALTDPEVWQAFFSALWVRLTPSYWGLANGGWFSWRGALAAIIFMLVFLALFYVAQFAARWLWRTSRGLLVPDGGRADIEFYRRLENLLAERAMIRSPSQTQREFAWTVGGQLAESAQTKHAAPLARQLVELFYRVRFGGRTLDSQEVVAVEQALSELAGALAHGDARRA